jgi:hypothetical protein
VYNVALKEVAMKKQNLIRWLLAFGLLTIALAGCKPPTGGNELPSIPNIQSKP